jgi:hypothetical protein
MSPLAIQLVEQIWSGLANKVQNSVWNPTLNKIREIIPIHIQNQLTRTNLFHSLSEVHIKNLVFLHMKDYRIDKPKEL